jgi:hypothetical protein
MASFTLADLEQNDLTPDVAENSKPNAFVSALAGIGSGLFKIPEGFVSLGATLIDLGADTNKAAEVEKFFAKINPFDEYAEATTAGKITELIVNIGVPAGMAFKVGTGLAKGALIAKRKDQYLDLGGDMSKAIQKKLKGTKLTRPETRLVDEAFSKTGTGLDKTIAYGTGAGLGGLAEGLFIDDVSEAGSFGDLVGGPTALDRDKKNPETELLNRLRFGIEGVAFTGLLGAAGKTISRIRNQTGTGRAITGKFNQWTDKYLSQPIRSRGAKPQIGFEIEKTMEGRIARDTNVTENAMERINKIAGNIQDKTKKTYGNKTSNRTREKLDEKLNNFLMSDKYLTPNIKQVEEISGNELKKTFVFDIRKIPKTDPITSLPYRVGFGQFKDLKPGAQLPDKAKVLDKKTGKFIKDDLGNDVLEDTMSAEEVVNVQFNKPTEKALKDFKTDFKKTFKATDQELDGIIDEYDRVRGNVEELLTVYASRLTPDALQEFGTMMRNSFKDAFDRGYDVFKNNKGDLKLAKNYRPTQKVLEETAESFVNDVATKSKGKLKLTKQEAMTMADEIWDGTELAKGVLLGQGTRAAGQVFLKSVPDFYVKSIADTLANTKKQIVGQSNKLLKDLTPEGQKVIKNLLGKTKNPMSTLVEGTANLSSQVRFNQYLDDLAKENNRRTNTWNRWNDGYTEINPRTGKEITVAPKTGPEPPIPFLFDDTGKGRKIAGGDSRNYQQILGTAARAQEGTALGKFSDPLATLKPLDETERAAQIIKQQDAKLQALENARLKAAEKGETLTKSKLDKIARKAEEDALDDILNPLAGKVAFTEYADALTKTKELSKSFLAQIYQNTVLYPKATAQMAKTILAPFTHARNFISAAAFAGANGLLPFGNIDDVKKAFNALQVKGFRRDNPLYQELLELGVVNSQVQLRDLLGLMEDAKFGSILNRIGPDFNGVNTFLRKMASLKKGFEDAYTAEDDFWKIFTYFGEKSRLKNAYNASGLKAGMEFVDPNGVKQIFNDEYLKKEAANLVKNQVPNYAFVSEAVRGIRRLPIGNFVAFPAEILRTGTNIVSRALDEINYKVIINGKEKTPLKARGLQRLFGMVTTSTVLPAGLVSVMSTIYDVSKEEIEAMRRYVPEWSKNSTLIPFKDKDGNLEYIDFSHMNAYDTLVRPIQTVINAVNEGKQDKDGIMGDFLLGLIESTSELGQPFITESMWTAALQDVSPILGRGGVDASGRRIYDLDVDSVGDAFAKSILHLGETQVPLNWKQLERLGMSIIPKDNKGRFNERGDQFELGNELLGIAGLRRVEVNPQKGLTYKVTDYKKGIRAARNIFTRRTLKGGEVTPEEVVDAYIDSNKALFEVNREMYKNMKAAQTLGLGEGQIEDVMIRRGERNAFNSLIDGEFRPYKMSNDVESIFEINAERLGFSNPLNSALDVLDNIYEILTQTPTSLDVFPNLPNPFRQSIIPNLGSTPVGQLPPLVSGATTSVVNANAKFGSIPYTQLPQDQKLDRIEKVDKLI